MQQEKKSKRMWWWNRTPSRHLSLLSACLFFLVFAVCLTHCSFLFFPLLHVLFFTKFSISVSSLLFIKKILLSVIIPIPSIFMMMMMVHFPPSHPAHCHSPPAVTASVSAVPTPHQRNYESTTVTTTKTFFHRPLCLLENAKVLVMKTYTATTKR